MRRTRRFRILSGLALFAGCLLAPAVLRAGVVGSPHDFSDTVTTPQHPTKSTDIAPQGACSACHLAHQADSYVLWARGLGSYGSALDTNGDPNYVLPPTIQCYDCHDFHGGAGINDVPALTNFDGSHKPQDIAFGFLKNSTGSMAEDGPTSSSALKIPGYYENSPPYSSHYGANPNIALPGNLDNTGGHYFKRTDPTGSSQDAFDIGDKLPCRDCHDPHAWDTDWQAFFRKNWPGSPISSYIGSSVVASSYMANAPISGTRDTLAGGRKLCLACHGTSNYTTPPGARAPVTFNDISSAYSTSTAIARPPDRKTDAVTGAEITIAAHRGASNVACVRCHNHNSVDSSCVQCHGFPPPGYPSATNSDRNPTRNPEAGALYAYPGGAAGLEQTHARHVGHFSDNAARFSPYSFGCAVCHANTALHPNDNVDVVFDLSGLGKASPPGFQPFVGASYTRSSCTNIYCHSLGLSDNTVNPVVPPSTTVPYFRSVTWGTAPLGCNGCHGTTTASDNVDYGMPEYVSGEPGSASANSHAAHVVGNGYECSVCHYNTADGTYLTARTIRGAPGANAYHVNGSRDIAFGTPVTGSYNEDNTVQANNKRCAVSCHNSQALPLAQQPQWGNPGSATCTACHLTSAADSDQYLAASDTWFQNGVTANLDNAEWFWAGHGRPASSGNYQVSGRPAADLLGGGTGDNPCLYCHDPNVGHRQAANPFRLVRQDNVTGFSGLGWNATCFICHRRTTPRPGYDPDGAATVYASKVATAAFVDNAHWGAEHGATNGGKFCWDCHDPHGDRNSSGTGNIYMVHKQRLARLTDNTFGYPGAGGALTTNAPVFTNVTSGTNYADNTTSLGICQVCHTLATTGHYRSNFGDDHNAGSRCTTCHAHDAAFAANKCEGCHGGEDGDIPPVNGAPKVTKYWKYSGHGRNAAATCENCHDVGSPSPSTHTTSGSGTFNTYNWPGKAADTTNSNTPHLKSFYIGSGAASDFQIAFDGGCYYGNGVSCHAQKGVENHRHTKNPTTNQMRFGRASTTINPKGFTWYTPGSYDNDFYMSRSPWVIHDVTTSAGVADPPSAPYYGVCVSCHDPHGTGTTDNTYGGQGFTNHMVRGKWLGGATVEFCNGACHR